jgi:septal ring factor EnvC (AmiA/AmiB activator)
MSTDRDIEEIKTAIATISKDVSEIKTGIAVIQTTSAATQGDVEEIKDTLKNHDGRIRTVEVGLGTQATRSGIIAAFSLIGSVIAAALGINQ